MSEYRSSNASKLISKYVATDDDDDEDDEDDFVDVFLLQTLMAGETYILHVRYTAPLHEDPIGFFRNAHVDPDTNETRYRSLDANRPDDRMIPDPPVSATSIASTRKIKHNVELNDDVRSS